jgi:hypothetical protein
VPRLFHAPAAHVSYIAPLVLTAAVGALVVQSAVEGPVTAASSTRGTGTLPGSPDEPHPGAVVRAVVT